MDIHAVALITREPNEIWLDFLSTFRHYDVYIILDNLECDIRLYAVTYPTLRFIQIPNRECIDHGYIHSSYMPTSSLHFNEIIAWDRALYYFTNVNRNTYDHVWFFEDDVFFYGESTILAIDAKMVDADLVCRDKHPEPGPGEWGWFWPVITIGFDPPYFHSPICAVRMSKTLLSAIDEYVRESRKLFFIEAMFSSIAHLHGLKYQKCEEEMETLYWRREWRIEEFRKNQIYHPVKNLEEHARIRSWLDSDGR
jgi:hypothetical protein